jgi:hypothetical protein
MKSFIKHRLNEGLKNICPVLSLSKEVINYVNQFDSDEQLLRKGGLPSEILDRMAFGFSEEDIKELLPKQLKIKWKDDLENVKWEVKKSGLTPKAWSSKINLSEPIDVSFEKNNFYIEDGHHRYFAAKMLNKPLNVNLQIKQNPIVKLSNLSYDDFHRCLFKQVKSNINEQMIDGINMNKGIETLCNKMSVNSYQEVLQHVQRALEGISDDKKVHLMQRIHVPLENLRHAQDSINSEIKHGGMSGDSIPDEADTYWHQIQTVLCGDGPHFQ